MSDKGYLKKKRLKVLEAIKPICDVFGITEYDFDITTERLILNNQQIGCASSSIDSIIDELIGYIFIKRYCHNRYLGAFQTQTKNVIMKYWIDKDGKQSYYKG